MTPQAVMDRYREGPSGPSLAKAIRMDAQEKGQQHWHQIHERCWCGHLTVPAGNYEYDKDGNQTNTQAQAEKAYLRDETTVTKRDEIGASLAHVKKAVPTVGGAQPGRPKKHADHAARQKAYRERQSG